MAAALMAAALHLAAAAPKQGFSGFVGGMYNCSDAAALGLAGSWSYTWTHSQSQGNRCRGEGTTTEFVPMIVGVGSAATVSDGVRRQWAQQGVRYLLGYNEPDPGHHPHMCSPAEAAADWHNIQVLADMFTPPLEIVSPAVSTTGVDADGASQWLDEFFGNCTALPGCETDRIKHIAFHDYGGDVAKLVRRIDGLAARYNRPLWLTEFAINRWAGGYDPTRADQDAYMRAVLPVLDASPHVFRYAWYSARSTGSGALLARDIAVPTLTSTGAIYKTHAQGARP